MDTRHLNTLVSRFRLLAGPSRLRLLALLSESGELDVSTLAARLGQRQTAVSHNLSLLHSAGLVACRRAGKHSFYRLSRPGLLTSLLEHVE